MESRKQFFAYILTLLRGQFCEMEGMLPAVDVTSVEHLAWTFDSLFYLLQVCVFSIILICVCESVVCLLTFAVEHSYS